MSAVQLQCTGYIIYHLLSWLCKIGRGQRIIQVYLCMFQAFLAFVAFNAGDRHQCEKNDAALMRIGVGPGWFSLPLADALKEIACL